MNLRIVALSVLLIMLVGCAQPIVDIKNEDHIGKTVIVSGTVENVIKIGSLSGYTLKDANGDTIGVSAERLPAEGDQVTVNGVLIKDTIFGYYIKQD